VDRSGSGCCIVPGFYEDNNASLRSVNGRELLYQLNDYHLLNKGCANSPSQKQKETTPNQTNTEISLHRGCKINGEINT
jgi:hypothetical protein